MSTPATAAAAAAAPAAPVEAAPAPAPAAIPADAPFVAIGDLSPAMNEQTVIVRGHVHDTRVKGKKFGFMVLRKTYDTVQVVVGADLVPTVQGLTRETMVDVVAKVSVPPNPVRGTTSPIELHATQIIVLGAAIRTPFVMTDAMRSDKEITENPSIPHVELPIRLDNRVLDLRTPANIAIFRVRAAIAQYFREYMVANSFHEINTPKLLSGSSEGGSSVFTLKYFERPCSLAQSPQLYKQMAICGGEERVFEVGPVFRAEASDTHRHLCEFTGLDFEMEIQRDYHELTTTLYKMFVYVFDNLAAKNHKELEIINGQHPFEPLVYAREPVIIPWEEGVRLVREMGGRMGDDDDLCSDNEKLLGKAIRQQYNTDIFILDGFPTAVRPFYTMSRPENPRYARAFDCFLRGEEITSGAQRVHDAVLLESKARAAGVELPQAYLDGFRFGAPPTAALAWAWSGWPCST
eukprot:GAFH01001533.1.p2 GENE.GAFH01001533.1~~GAFH01001533.1.p2  ORF type:complete len:463 (-),score=197.35 GAFH01001533.1:175-1563(-)